MQALICAHAVLPRHVDDEGDDDDRCHERDRTGAQPQSALGRRHGEPVREGRTQRTGHDVGGPERERGVRPRRCAMAGTAITTAKRMPEPRNPSASRGRQVPQRRPQAEREEYRGQ